jgi:hypothetical protein
MFFAYANNLAAKTAITAADKPAKEYPEAELHKSLSVHRQ